MIESGTARDLVEMLLRVEERLTRLLTSGWRQAGGEAADLRGDAEALTDAGLPSLGARVAAVAAATDAASALQAIALAASACQLMRTRLLAVEPPPDWPLIRPPKSHKRTTDDTVVPLARLTVDGTEVWASAWSARNQVVLLEGPFPDAPQALMLAAQPPPEPTGMLGRLQRRISRALDGTTAGEQEPPSAWIRQPLGGTLRWAGRHPIGATGDIAVCSLDDAHWTEAPKKDDQSDQFQAFRTSLGANQLRSGFTLTWALSGLKVMVLDQREWAAYAWIDQSAAAAFGQYDDPSPLALVWQIDQIVTPLALLEPGTSGRKSKVVHLITGLPSDAVSSAD
jgi:hypothetical protein